MRAATAPPPATTVKSSARLRPPAASPAAAATAVPVRRSPCPAAPGVERQVRTTRHEHPSTSRSDARSPTCSGRYGDTHGTCREPTAELAPARELLPARHAG